MCPNSNCAAKWSLSPIHRKSKVRVVSLPQNFSTFCSSIKIPKIPLVYVIVICVLGLLCPLYSVYFTDTCMGHGIQWVLNKCLMYESINLNPNKTL